MLAGHAGPLCFEVLCSIGLGLYQNRKWPGVGVDVRLSAAANHNKLTMPASCLRYSMPVCLLLLQVEPAAIMNMLNELYNRYDALCDAMPVYKVRMVVSGRQALECSCETDLHCV